MTALSTFVFAYAGAPAFFPLAAEMREPRHFGRALVLSQFLVTALYLSVGVTVYYYCGSYIASPALGSAGHTMKRVSYGLAVPGLVITAILILHVRKPPIA
jgi:amino acid permease